MVPVRVFPAEILKGARTGTGSRSRFLKKVLVSTVNLNDLENACSGWSPKKKRRASIPQTGSFAG